MFSRVFFPAPSQTILATEEQNEEKLRIARKELEWDSEKSSIALHKLKSLFLDTMAVERIVLRAFKTNRVVSSFRTAELSALMQKHVNFVHDLINGEEMKRQMMEEVECSHWYFALSLT